MNETANNSTPAKKGGCGTWLLAGIAGLAVLVWLGSKGEQEEKSAREAAASGAGATDKPIVTVTASELQQQFAANEVAAKEAYDGKRIKVTGKIESIGLDVTDSPFVVLGTAQMFQNVQVAFTKDDVSATSALQKGQAFAALCDEVGEVVGTPMLRKCTIVPAGK